MREAHWTPNPPSHLPCPSPASSPLPFSPNFPRISPASVRRVLCARDILLPRRVGGHGRTRLPAAHGHAVPLDEQGLRQVRPGLRAQGALLTNRTGRTGVQDATRGLRSSAWRFKLTTTSVDSPTLEHMCCINKNTSLNTNSRIGDFQDGKSCHEKSTLTGATHV